MEFVGPILEILKCIGTPSWKYIEYHRKFGEYEKKLKELLEQLESQKNDLESRLRTECTYGKLPKSEVNKWLENVEMIINDPKMEHKFKNGKYLSRANRAKLFDQKIQEVEGFYRRGSSFNSLVIDAPPTSGLILRTTTMVGETTTMDEIRRHLIGNKVKKIGVYGMGGIGKTTIVTQINNRLVKEHKFNHVIWVTISQAFDLIKVQNEIANALKQSQSLSGSEDKKRRATMLSSMLEGKKFVLILDDVWKAIDLEELGIPEPTDENGCKLVITTRSLEVCRQMGCKTVNVEPLSEKGALELFVKKAELDISEVPTLKEIMELVLKQCAGLPLAIVTVASSMKGEYDILEWRNALKELCDNIISIKISMDEEVFGRLKFSYDRLNNENIQRCFLYCALYPEDFDIPKNELVDCWIREGFVDEMDNLQAKEERARIIIKKIVDNCLLLESTNYNGISCVKLHDVVRDMTLKYITRKSPLFMVKAGLKLEEPPSEQEWKENLSKVSLMKNRIREIPSSMSPNCSSLSTLLLQENSSLAIIHESFFSQMHGLKILTLSWTEIESLPNSISELTNLTALLLNNCYRLKHVPSLAKLQSLRELELGRTIIEEVPAGMKMLTNLTSLNLLSNQDISKFPAGIFSRLSRLEKLEVYLGLETPRETAEEATRLKNLHRLVAHFHHLQDFNCFVKSLNIHQYFLAMSTSGAWDSRRRQYGAKKEVFLQGRGICGREEVDSIFLPKDVEYLSIYKCNDVRNICDVPTFTTLERLEILHVDSLQNLTTLSESSSGQYSHLKGVRVTFCGALKKFFSTKMLPELKNLERIDMIHCDEIEELIAVDEGDDKDERNQKEFSLPKLKRLNLDFVSNLKSICSSNGLMVFDSLQVMKVHRCPKLKNIISTSKLQLDILKNLKLIEVEDCDEMEEIIALDEVDEEETSKKELIHLPKLRRLILVSMPKLKSIINNGGSNGVMVCESLLHVTIFACPQFKRLPFHLPIDEKGEPSPPPALERILTTQRQWEALEWDHLHPQATSVLLPFIWATHSDRQRLPLPVGYDVEN